MEIHPELQSKKIVQVLCGPCVQKWQHPARLANTYANSNNWLVQHH